MKKVLLSTVAAATLIAAPAVAQEAGDYMFGFGVGYVDPTDDNLDLGGGTFLQVDSGVALTFTAEYYYTDNIAIELLLATPFNHDISVDGAGKVGETDHLPPTLSVNYHFNDFGAFRPFVGVGINYTNFFQEKSDLGVLELDDSWGLAFTVGAEYDISDNGALRFDVRYIDIDTDATLDGADLGTVEIDPLVFSAAYVWKF
ncbi:OmpW/AlkL family protein [Tropicimonas sp. S265A]|uniref:OmpW/AlkL family protein n=1 Tax=Tropicimonas sp. S265A TaxID=3415134 RepID=UPI003C7DD5EA